MRWDDSGTKALVGSQFVLARDVEFSCAASLTFVSWNGSARGSLLTALDRLVLAIFRHMKGV